MSPAALLPAAKRLWRALAPKRMRSLAGPVALRMARDRARAGVAHGEPAQAPGPLIVSGLLSESKGVSEGARLTIAGLAAAGLAPIAHDLRPALTGGIGADARLPADGPGGVWLMHVNAPEMVHALAAHRAADWLGRRRIGYWAYELQPIPQAWAEAASLLHEIWAPSHFVADAIVQAGVTTPVRVVPHPVHLSQRALPDRSSFDIPPGAFTVLAMGDLASSATRKNLMGAIEIYRRAFPEPVSGPGGACLIVKTHSQAGDPRFAAMAAEARAGRPDIVLLCDDLSRAGVTALIASADVLLSPHRSEGFGLVLAEAFLNNVPALATGWSGNMDFMAGLDELLIPSRLVAVRDTSGVYRGRGRVWADPDADAAAARLRALQDDPAMRAALVERGRRAVLALAGAWMPAALAMSGLGGLVTPAVSPGAIGPGQG
jgi:glycosyltransferase involved in cell wall biosynthesis